MLADDPKLLIESKDQIPDLIATNKYVLLDVQPNNIANNIPNCFIVEVYFDYSGEDVGRKTDAKRLPRDGPVPPEICQT